MRLYLSGAISGQPNGNREAFEQAAEALRAQGHAVLSPIELDDTDGVDPGADHDAEEYARLLARDMLLIAERRIEGVVLLDGWENSAGAKAEIAFARACGLGLFRFTNGGLAPFESQENVLQTAQRLVLGDRGGTYGHPYYDFQRAAQIMEAVLGHEVRVDQVPLLMMAVKLSRLHNSPNHRDSIVDIAGYALTWEMVRERMEAV